MIRLLPMSKKANKNRKAKTQSFNKRGVPISAIIVSAMVIVAALAIGWWKWKTSNQQPANRATAATDTRPDLHKLKGRWLRPDGDYVLEIIDVDNSGKMVASYFNPQPINVSRARASYEGANIKVFVELQDVNYPGSTYDLTYQQVRDQLEGIYYQAALQQNFEVIFVRMK